MRHAFVFGSNGPSNWKPLRYAVTDAVRIADALSQQITGYNVNLFPSGSSASTVRDALFNAVELCTVNDTFLCYFSGHGLLDPGSADLILLTDSSSLSRLLSSALSSNDFLRALRKCPARQKLLILDCCYAAGAVEELGFKSGNDIPIQRIFQPSDNFVLILASGKLEVAFELPEIGGSFLTWAICQALTEDFYDADFDQDGVISINDLQHWINYQVRMRINDTTKTQVPFPVIFGEQKGDPYFLTLPPIQMQYLVGNEKLRHNEMLLRKQVQSLSAELKKQDLQKKIQAITDLGNLGPVAIRSLYGLIDTLKEYELVPYAKSAIQKIGPQTVHTLLQLLPETALATTTWRKSIDDIFESLFHDKSCRTYLISELAAACALPDIFLRRKAYALIMQYINRGAALDVSPFLLAISLELKIHDVTFPSILLLNLVNAMRNGGHFDQQIGDKITLLANFKAALNSHDPIYRTVAIICIDELGENTDRVDLLSDKMLDPNEMVAIAAFHAVGRSGQSAIHLLPQMIAASKNTTMSDPLRLAAIYAASKIDQELSADILIEIVNENRDNPSVIAGVYAKRIPDLLFSTLVRLLKSKDYSVRQASAERLRHIAGPHQRRYLQNLLRYVNDPDEYVCRGVIRALGRMGYHKHTSFALAKRIESSTTIVRAAIAEALGSINAVETVADLITMLTDGNADVRASAASGLGNMQMLSLTAIHSITDTLYDQERAVCVAAAKALANIGRLASTALPALQFIYSHKGDELIRQEVRRAIRVIIKFEKS